MSDDQFIKAFQENYTRVSNYTGGSDLKLTISLASKYTLSKRQFSGVILQQLIEQIERNSNKGFQIRLGYSISYKLAAYLLQQENLNEEITRLASNEAALAEVKIRKTPSRLLGALFLRDDKLAHAQRAKQLFDEMNRNQRILTSKEDIPYAVFLTADSNAHPKALADTIVRYYSELRKNHFTMGNNLQALAQIMASFSADFNEILLQYVVQLREELLKRNIKVKKIHYPYLGVLALTATNEMKIDEIVSLHNQLLEQKIFKNANQYALIVAIQKIVQDLIEIQDLIDMVPLMQLYELIDIVDFILELGYNFPSGISDVVDFFN